MERPTRFTSSWVVEENDPESTGIEESQEIVAARVHDLYLIDREKINQQLQLIEARLLLEEKDILPFAETDALKLGSIQSIARLLIMIEEYKQALSFLKVFPKVINDMVGMLLKKFFYDKPSNHGITVVFNNFF